MGILNVDELLGQVISLVKQDPETQAPQTSSSQPSNGDELDQVLRSLRDKDGPATPTQPSSESTSLSDEPWRNVILQCAINHVNSRTPYQWGGGRNPNDYGVDCSGLVLDCARKAGKPIAMNANMMFHDLPSVAEPKPGDLALYGNGDKGTHVRIVESWDPVSKIAKCIGAEGGNNEVTSLDIAKQRGAFVKRVSSHKNRGGFLGFRTLSSVPYRRKRSMSNVEKLEKIASLYYLLAKSL